jgi:type II secretory pathway pseudopilin PulG
MTAFAIPPLKPEHRQPKTGSRNRLLEVLALSAVVGLIAMLALPNFVRSRSASQSNEIVNNLRQLDGAKQQWALEAKQTTDAEPTWDDLKPYLGRDGELPPVAGESYYVGKVSESPKALAANGTITLDGDASVGQTAAPNSANRVLRSALSQAEVAAFDQHETRSLLGEPALSSVPTRPARQSSPAIVLPEVNGLAPGAGVAGASGVGDRDANHLAFQTSGYADGYSPQPATRSP